MKKIFLSLLSFIAVFAMFLGVKVLASDGTEINPNDKSFENASTVYTPNFKCSFQFFSFNGSINIVHFKVNEEGYYDMYADYGSTVGKLFEKGTSGIFWAKRTVYNDLTGSVKPNKNVGGGFKITKYLYLNKDYYIASRIIGGASGTYNFVLEKGCDKITSNSGGTWKSNTYSEKYCMPNYGSHIYEKNYYTKYQAMVLCQLLRSERDNNAIHNYWQAINGPYAMYKKICDFTGMFLNVVLAPDAAGVTVDMLGDMFEGIFLLDTSGIDEMLAKLKATGVWYKKVNGKDEYYAENSIVITRVLDISAYSNPFTGTSIPSFSTGYSISKYSGNVLLGACESYGKFTIR